MSAGRRLVLVRHGQTAWNAEGRAQGHADVPLDETGRAQAERMATVVAELEPVLLASSDLSRARETAAFVEKATGLTAIEDPRLREYDVGARTGLTLAEFGERVGSQVDTWWDVNRHFTVEGAESDDDVLARMVPALRELLARLGSGETGVVVLHGAAMKLGLGALLGWPGEVAGTLTSMDNCHWAVVAETVDPVGENADDTPVGRLRLASYNVGVGGR